MELDNTIQISKEQLQNQHFDVFIAVSGSESRCTFLASKLKRSDIQSKIALSIDELHDNSLRIENDKKFSEWGFTLKECSALDTSTIDHLLSRYCHQTTANQLDILIDYSSMPKIWYSSMINFFIAYEEKIRHVNLWFTYSPSEYFKSNTTVFNKTFEPLPPQIKSYKPIALIVGLGYEKSRSEELSKQADANVTFAFFADPAYDERFVKEVLDNNQSFLKHINGDQIIRYPIFDLNSINSSLTKLCVNLRTSHQLILAPIGPKPFTLMCFLLSARYPDMKIWKLISSQKSGKSDRVAQGELLIYKVMFTSEEVDY
jgi:hypothetical protein